MKGTPNDHSGSSFSVGDKHNLCALLLLLRDARAHNVFAQDSVWIYLEGQKKR